MHTQAGPNRALWQAFAEHAQPLLERWLALCEQPERTQERVLQQLLAANRESAFGRAHHFSSIKDVARFRKQVPIHTYTRLSPWIQRAQDESGPVLTSSPPLFFERTSGNSAVQKNIPYTRAFLTELQSALVVWLADMYRQVPEIGHGCGYWSMSPPSQAPAVAANGIAIGSTCDLAYLDGSRIAGLAATLVIPDLVQESAHWRRQTLLALLANPDLSFISVWSPTFLTSLLQPVFDSETAENRQTFAWLQAALPVRRARALRHARAQGLCSELWPRLAAVSCWMDGPSRGYARQLASRFPQVRWLGKGLLATEGVVSVPFGDGLGRPLALGSHYLEFLGDDGAARDAHSLRLGETAQVLLTTGGGLYRYALGDRVRVVGMLGRTPRVEFVGRAAGGCDLVGEKLDDQLVGKLLARCIDTADSACLVPDAHATPPHYVVLVASTARSDCQDLAQHIETTFQDAFHYAHARRLGQLGPMRTRVLGGGADRLSLLLQQAAERSGIRAGDVKPRPLISRLETADALLALTEAG